ncbi:isochorismatase [Streptomyces sp. WM6373]|uniref:cysteine hydrolase n=1 Tax=Streptomyces TaxID=1883 RepID=UPI0006AFB182|nr:MULTISPECIES: cysteine hydrolase [unclassified Streptomyces]KOU29978.1 isochorismatase [Streptomyces sp. WM6373]KOU70786.1 isochorismatase [Streptomyces sp. XY66]KOU97516.1 isochorismatase [Streptomyces sp. XY58]KOV02494.1 isochorismatase [Streptomyces sp. XY37]KOV48031.1 isochorismatase [Streptomyces sp. MMG1064]
MPDLDPATTALLTVECQNGVVGEESALPELAKEARDSGMLRRVAALVDAARGAGVQVLHAVAERRPDGLGANSNARLFRAAGKLPVRQLTGSRAVEVAAPITVADRDLVVRRLHGLSPMAGTDLDALLRNLGIRTLVVTGVSSNIAIPNTVFDAVNLGYQVVVPADAIAGVPASCTGEVIRNSLALVAAVTTTEALLDEWGRAS